MSLISTVTALVFTIPLALRSTGLTPSLSLRFIYKEYRAFVQSKFSPKHWRKFHVVLLLALLILWIRYKRAQNLRLVEERRRQMSAERARRAAAEKLRKAQEIVLKKRVIGREMGDLGNIPPQNPAVLIDVPLDPQLAALEHKRRLKFLSQTKYVAAIGPEVFFELFHQLQKVCLQPDEMLFQAGDRADRGMYIVSKGRLGLFRPDAECALPTAAQVKRAGGFGHAPDDSPHNPSYRGTGEPIMSIPIGESVGEFSLIGDLPDELRPESPNKSSSPSPSPVQIPYHRFHCAALEYTECYFLPRSTFLAFTRKNPRSLLDFVRTAVARQWRVASYVLDHFLELPPKSREEIQGSVHAAMLDFTEFQQLLREDTKFQQLTGKRFLNGRTGGLVEKIAQQAAEIRSPPASAPAISPAHFGAIPAAFSRFRGVKLLSLAAGDPLFQVGDSADTIFLINSGRLEAVNDADEVQAVIPAGAVAGGISYFGGTVRGETLRALEDSTVYEYSRAAIEALSEEEPLLLLPLVRAVARQLAPVCQQFYDLGLQTSWFRSGHLIFRQGQESDAVYLTISGRIRLTAHLEDPHNDSSSADFETSFTSLSPSDSSASLSSLESIAIDPLNPQAAVPPSCSDADPTCKTTNQNSSEQYLFECGRGELFGEDANLDFSASGETVGHSERTRRPYTAVCIRDSEVVRVSNAAFLSLFEANPRAMFRFSRMLTRRLHQLANKARFHARQKASETNIATIAIIPIGKAGFSSSGRSEAAAATHLVREFGLRLQTELKQYGTVLWVNSSTIRTELGARTADNLHEFVHRSKTARWLSEMEENNRFILFEADPVMDEAELQAELNASQTPVNKGEIFSAMIRSARGSAPSPNPAVAPTGSSPSASFSSPLQSSPTGDQGSSSAESSFFRSAPSRPRSISSWTRLAVEQADCILLLGNFESPDPSVSRWESELIWRSTGNSNGNTPKAEASATPAETPVAADSQSAEREADEFDEFYGFEDVDRVDVNLARHKDVILLHPSSSASFTPKNTRRWLENRPVRSHHHIRREVTADYARLARFLAGETIGLVLSGGGARGLAHLGVLKAMEESGIPIDCIGGASQGAFMAALYAKHLSSEAMYAPASEFASNFSVTGLLTDLTLPILSYFTGHGFTQMVRTALGSTIDIEDTWIRYFCITTNVKRSDSIVHTRGKLYKYVRSSMTVLGLLPPVQDGDEILVDGGYSNNLPIQAMQNMGANFIIAVDVEDKDTSGFDDLYSYSDGISGFYILWLKLMGAGKVPDFMQILGWLACLNHTRQLREAVQNHTIDLYVRPAIEKFGLLDYLKKDEIIAAGYEAGMKAIDAWKRKLEKQAEIQQKAIEKQQFHEIRRAVQQAQHRNEAAEIALEAPGSDGSAKSSKSRGSAKMASLDTPASGGAKKPSVNFSNRPDEIMQSQPDRRSPSPRPPEAAQPQTSQESAMSSSAPPLVSVQSGRPESNPHPEAVEIARPALVRALSAPNVTQPPDGRLLNAMRRNTGNADDDDDDDELESESGSSSVEATPPSLSRALSLTNTDSRVGRPDLTRPRSNSGRSTAYAMTRNSSMAMLRAAANTAFGPAGLKTPHLGHLTRRLGSQTRLNSNDSETNLFRSLSFRSKAGKAPTQADEDEDITTEEDPDDITTSVPKKKRYDGPRYSPWN